VVLALSHTTGDEVACVKGAWCFWEVLDMLHIKRLSSLTSKCEQVLGQQNKLCDLPIRSIKHH